MVFPEDDVLIGFDVCVEGEYFRQSVHPPLLLRRLVVLAFVTERVRALLHTQTACDHRLERDHVGRFY